MSYYTIQDVYGKLDFNDAYGKFQERVITSKNDIAPNLATELAIYQHLLYKRQAVKMSEPVVDMSEPVWYCVHCVYCM